MTDYADREYLSATEVAAYAGMQVRAVHHGIKIGTIPATKATSGQFRIKLRDIQHLKKNESQMPEEEGSYEEGSCIEVGDSTHRTYLGDSRNMSNIADASIHLAITSPPYFNAKMYSQDAADLGNVHNLDQWLEEIGKVWGEVYRTLCPGRKFFVNIMNLPIRINKSFRSLNLVGKNIDLCEEIGFIFKRDIVWHKTNGVKAHFGTYPYPGSILLNHMHEFILEFEKPAKAGTKKYSHLTEEMKEASKLDKDFWVEIKKSDVWLMKPERSGDGRSHAAPFPLELPRRLILAYSFKGETIFDPFMGSGTTALAAAQHDRNSLGYEINSEFLDSIHSRLGADVRKPLIRPFFRV